MRTLHVTSVLLLSFLMMSCEDTTTTSPTGQACTTKVAHIEVLDGSMIRLCGCLEPNNTTFGSGETLTCTVNAGTVLYFDFVGITVTHQVTITGVAATPIVAPNSSEPTQIYPMTLNSTGTFPMYDIFFPTIGGNIIVQ